MKKSYLSKTIPCRVALVVSLCSGTLISGVSGCAPGLGKTLSVHRVPEIEESESVLPIMTRGEAPLLVKISSVEDLRNDKSIGVISGRRIDARGSIEQAVGDLMKEEFERFGAEIQDPDGVSVQGRLKEWQVDVEPGFPSSTADALAVLEIQVSAMDGQNVYRARYEGSSVTEHPFLSENRIEETLGHALQHAVRAAIRDEQFRLAVMNASLP